MVAVGRLPKKFFPLFIFFPFLLDISYASHFNGHLEVFSLGESATASLASVGTFCVARPNADPTLLKSGLDWACGPGLANCGPIQPGQPCYVANNIVAIASYAFDAYYQANQGKGGTCSFSNTAMLTNTDPSTGSCIFPGSAGTGTNPSGGSGSSPGGSGSPPGGSGSPPGGSGTPPGGSGTLPGGSGTPPGGGSGISPGGSGTGPGSSNSPPDNSSFSPFQPTDGDGDGASAIQGLKLVYLLAVVFLSLLIL